MLCLSESGKPTSCCNVQVSPRRIEMKISSEPAAIAPVRRAIEDLCVCGGLDERAVGEVGLCVNEALANVIRHAYAGAAGKPIVVHADFANGELEVTIRDWGNGINPANIPPRPYDPLEPGGLGLICMKEMMSQVTYIPQKDGMLLILKKKKSGPATTTERP
jgi:serine/threonine-protein kinase RsbW